MKLNLLSSLCATHRPRSQGSKNQKGSEKRARLHSATRERLQCEGDATAPSSFSSFDSRKADSRVGQKPFIGLTSLPSGRIRKCFPICPGSHLPSPGSSWFTPGGKSVLDRGGRQSQGKVKGIGHKRGMRQYRKCGVAKPSR